MWHNIKHCHKPCQSSGSISPFITVSASVFPFQQLHLRRFYSIFSFLTFTVINLFTFETINVFLASVCHNSIVAEHDTLYFSKLEHWIKYSRYLTVYRWCHLLLMINLRVMCLVFKGIFFLCAFMCGWDWPSCQIRLFFF